MFKGRIWVWVIVIASCLVLKWCINTVPGWFTSDDISFKLDVKNDSDFSENMSDSNMWGWDVAIKSSDTDIIITDKEDKIDGYKKYDNLIYSPMVMYFTEYVDDNEDGFISVADDIFKMDFKMLLEALESGKSWQDIGVNKKVCEGAIKIYIPNEQNNYYDKVEELFYLTMNNGKIPTEEEKDGLKDRVDSLIKKCIKVTDIATEAKTIKEQRNKESGCLIGPEYLYKRDYDVMSQQYTDCFRPVYFLNTVYLYSDVYVKESTDEKKNIGEEYISYMRRKSNFRDECGWRVVDSEYDYYAPYLSKP